MAESAQTLHGHKISSDRPTMTQTIECRDACTQKGGRFRRRKRVRNCRHRFGSGNHVLRVAAIFVESSHLEVPTPHEIASPTRIACTIMSAMPAHAHPLALLPNRHARANFVDHSSHFVARDS